MARIRRAAQSAPQEVLVPEAEQPYAVPENWRWVRLGGIAETLSKGTTPKGGRSAYVTSGVAFVRVENFADDGTISHVNIAHISAEQHTTILKRSILEMGDVLISIAGTLGRIAIVGLQDLPANANQAVCFVRLKKGVYNRYIMCEMQCIAAQSRLLQKTKVTAIPNLTLEIIRKYMVPLPPRAEQERIVARIESLFARLDKAREKVDAVLGRCAARKAALLHKAFSGELTAAWRKARGIGLESWEEKLSGQLFSYVTSGSRGWAKYYSEEGALFIRMGNLSHETIELNLSEVQHVKLPDDIEGQRSKLKNNDILISITADVGMVALVRDINFEGYINQHVALARPVSTVCPEFLALYLISDAGKKELKARQRGSTKVGLGLDDIKSLHLKMPTLAEQAEIVRILDELLARERRARDAAERVAARIEQIKRAVLTKAFRGELGTNDPAEPAALTEQGSLSLA